MTAAPFSDNYNILALAKQGNPKAIALLMNRSLKPHHITARIGQKDNGLVVLLESETIPDRVAMVNFVRRGLTNLNLTTIREVRIYGRQMGQIAPAWSHTVAVEARSGDIKTFSLVEWLSQGQSESECWDDDGRQESDAPTLDSSLGSTQKFLRFHFSPEETALLPLSGVKEVLQVSVAGILPVPHMPERMVGLYNCRGEMLWLVDLGQQLGFPSSFPDGALPTTIMAIALHDQSSTMAIVVPQVSNIELHSLRQLQPPSADLFPAQLLPFMQGYLTRSSSPVLNATALIQDPTLRVHGTQLSRV